MNAWEKGSLKQEKFNYSFIHSSALHKFQSCARFTHSAYDLLLVHPLMSSIHILLGLRLCPLPSTFSSSNNFCTEFLRVMRPKYCSSLFIMVFNNFFCIWTWLIAHHLFYDSHKIFLTSIFQMPQFFSLIFL